MTCIMLQVVLSLLVFVACVQGFARERCEVVTLYYGDRGYVEGLIALGGSLYEHAPGLPRRVIVARKSGAAVSRQEWQMAGALEAQGWAVTYVDPLVNPFADAAPEITPFASPVNFRVILSCYGPL